MRDGCGGGGRTRRAVWVFVVLCALLLESGLAFAQARPITAYRGTIGETAVDVMLIHDWQLDGMSGYLVAAGGGPVPLEKTPYREDAPLLLNVMDDPRLPARTLALQPFAVGARTVTGRAIDLRSRAQQPLRLERVTLFSSDPRIAYDGELLQASADARFQFRVRARKAIGGHSGRVDRITVLDRATGTTVQVLDGLDLFFFGGETLTFADVNGDGVLDFSVTPVRPDDPTRGSEHAHHYVHQASGGYVRDTALDALAVEGVLRFDGQGRVSLRPQRGIDYRAGTIEWRHYRYVTPTQLEFVMRSEERF